MGCVGDGWHKVGDARVLVENRVIVKILMQNNNGEWTERRLLRWNNATKAWQMTGLVTINALRSASRRGTICVG